MSDTRQKVPGSEDSKWVELVLQQVRSLRYGVVEIIVHDSRVIQKRADLLVAIFKKTSASGCQPLHYFTDFEPDAV